MSEPPDPTPAWYDLNVALGTIARVGSLPVEAWPDSGPNPQVLGLSEISPARLGWSVLPDFLDATAIQQAFPHRQVLRFDAIDSTNSYLLKQKIDQTLCTAELQIGGRGRRGRSWLSPYARNLAMTLGFASQRPLSQLGGLSSVVGLALVAALESLGVAQAGLKWPNDVLVEDRKLCGILVELVSRPSQIEYVVGIGVNVRLDPDELQAIGQPAADLVGLGVQRSRTDLLITLLTQVETFIRHFEQEGFASFQQAFDQAHIYHGRKCQVHAGEEVIEGVVAGIGAEGELLLHTADGQKSFHGGEVSLRSGV